MVFKAPLLSGRGSVLLLVFALLAVGFTVTSFSAYYVSREAIRNTLIAQDLPLTASNIYSEIQRQLVRPVVVSTTMAHDTFLRDWVLTGEKDLDAIARYLAEVKRRFGAFSSFFVSDRTGNYYTAAGVLKRVSPNEPRDVWFYRVRKMDADYEINVDPDMANRDALTIFINYRVLDYHGNFLGATGVGLTVEAVRDLIADFQKRYQRTIYFVNDEGRVVLFGSRKDTNPELRDTEGIGALLDRILAERQGTYQFVADGANHILRVNYLPELKWLLFIEQNEDVALADVRRTLYINLVISFLVTLLVLLLTWLVLNRYHTRVEKMATTDKLTGLFNRHAAMILLNRALARYRRSRQPISVLVIDIDHFKRINDRYGHGVGDEVLRRIAQILRSTLRESDVVVRWGGEEFLILLHECDLRQAQLLAEKLRQAVQQAAVCGADRHVTISVGVASLAKDTSVEAWIERADAALYQAKANGRNQVVAAT